MLYKLEKWKTKFIIIWIGQAVSLLTSSVLQMAIVWYITQKTASSAVLSMATLIGFLPQAVLGTFIGVYVDRYHRKKIIICADLFIAAASFVLVIKGMFGEIPIALILCVLFVRSIGSAFHYPALSAITPMIVPKAQLTKYAGYAQSFESISMVASPALAAVVFRLWSLDTIILMDVFGALFAVGMLGLVSIPNIKSNKKSPHLLREVKEGYTILKTEKGMISLLVVSGLYAIIYFPIGSLYPLITMNYFGGTFADSSIVEVVFSVGMLLGSLFLGLVGHKMKKRTAIIGSIFIYGVGVCATGLLPSSAMVVFIVLSGVMGMTVPFYTGVETAIIQTRIQKGYLGRIFALSGSLTTITMPIGLILSGVFSDMVGIQNWFLILGICTLLLAVGSCLIPGFRYCDKESEKG